MPALASSRAVIFDLDGTLVDSLDDITTHLDAALADRGLPPRTRAEISEWVGYGSAHLVERAVPDPANAAGVLSGYRARYRAQPVIHTHLYDGIAAALDTIAPGRVLAVLSNKPHDETVAIAGALLARWSLAAVAGERAGVPRKPEAGAALAILADLGVSPADTVLVGDSEVDVATARAAGLTSVAVTWGFRSEAVLRAAAPDHLVTTPAALARLWG